MKPKMNKFTTSVIIGCVVFLLGLAAKANASSISYVSGQTLGTPINMSFIVDGTWAWTIISNCDFPINASALAGTYYEWDYSRIYLR